MSEIEVDGAVHEVAVDRVLYRRELMGLLNITSDVIAKANRVGTEAVEAAIRKFKEPG